MEIDFDVSPDNLLESPVKNIDMQERPNVVTNSIAHNAH